MATTTAPPPPGGSRRELDRSFGRVFCKKELQLSTEMNYFCVLWYRFSVVTAVLTVVAVLALIASITTAGIALELVHARAMVAVVGLTLVPI